VSAEWQTKLIHYEHSYQYHSCYQSSECEAALDGNWQRCDKKYEKTKHIGDGKANDRLNFAEEGIRHNSTFGNKSILSGVEISSKRVNN
jgi:hypothetical protein